MKKIFCLILCVCMMISIAACAAPTESGANTEFVIDESVESNLPRYKIAFMYSNYSDKLGSQYKASMEYIAEVMNVEFVFLEGGYGEETNAVVEAAAAAGDLDGFIMANAVNASLLESAGGLPVIAVCNAPASDEAAQESGTYDNYLGCVVNSDYAAGYEAGMSLYNAGCRKLCFAGLTHGMTRGHDQRTKGFLQFIEDHDDVTLLVDDYSRGQFPAAISAFAAAYPEMDGVFSASGNDAVFNAMTMENLVGSVKLACVDVDTQSGNYFDNGTLVYTAGGQYGTGMIGFALLYNYLADGTRIIADSTVPMERYYIEIRDSDDFDIYVKAVDSGVPIYTGREIRDMIHYYNEEVDYNYFVELAESFSLDELLARHADLLG